MLTGGIAIYSLDTLIFLAKNEDDLNVRADAVEKIDDEDTLKDIFLADDVTNVSILAMNQINDIDFLVDQCLNNPDSHLRLAILNRICDESLLKGSDLSNLIEKVLLNDPDSYVLKTAFEKAHSIDQNALIEVLNSNRDEMIIKEVLKNITDEELLADYALNDPDEYIRLVAIQNPNLSSIDIICKIISTDENELNRAVAIGKIGDVESLEKIIYKKEAYPFLGEISQNLFIPVNDYFLNHFIQTGCYIDVLFIKDSDFLENLILNETDSKIRAFAIKNKNFTNQEILEKLIIDETDHEILLEVVSKIKNEDLLTDYIKNHLNYGDVIVKAILRINDLEFLEWLCENNDSRIRLKAVEKISNMKNTEEMLHKIALSENEEEICITAVNAMDKRNNLIEIAEFRSENNIRMAALNKIKPKILLYNFLNPAQKSSHDLPFDEVLAQIALNDDDLSIRRIATSKLSDKHVLNQIVQNNDEISLTAQKRLNTLFEDIKSVDSPRVLDILINSLDKDVSHIAKLTRDDLKTWRDRIAHVNEIDDMDELKNIASNDFNYFVRNEAEGRLEKLIFNVRLDEVKTHENQEKFRAIYLDESFPSEIRKKALLKITDKDFLKDN